MSKQRQGIYQSDLSHRSCDRDLLCSLPASTARRHQRRGPIPSPARRRQPRPRGKPGAGIETQAKHALIVEVETGTVLLDKLADERMPPASMSKIMTAYMVFDMLKQGRAKLEDELPVSERAWRLQGSKMFVPIGGRIKIDDLLKGMIIQSGNDACLVLAEGLAGSEEAFVELMNQKAKEIGLKDSHFANVDGLPNPDHWMTARDLATLSIRTIKDFPEYIRSITDKWNIDFNNIKQGNRNPLLYKGGGADGLKTGHTEEAGLQPDRLGQARRAAHHHRARRLADDEGARPGERAADRMGVSRIQRLQAGRGRRQGRGCRGMARRRAESAADRRQGSGRDPAAQGAQGDEGHGRIRPPDPGARSRRARRSASWS